MENWLELITIVLAGVILYVPDEKFSTPCETKRTLAAFAIVISWATLITLIGRHPKLAQYNIYVTMFYKILETFGTFLIWYSFFLVAFSLGFYIMLHKDSPAGGRVLHSHLSRKIEAVVSLRDVATPALLCHKDTAQGSQSPYFAVSLWHKGGFHARKGCIIGALVP